MLGTWSRLSRGQKRTWGLLSGVILVGSAVKVVYFNFSRGLMVRDQERQTKDGMRRLHEAKQFASWSQQDREARLPTLTAEQREQMRAYLDLVKQHGVHESMAGRECKDCPVLQHGGAYNTASRRHRSRTSDGIEATTEP